MTCPTGMMASPIWGYELEQMQEVAGERGGYLHGRGGSFTLSHSVILSLKTLSSIYFVFMFLKCSFSYAALDSDDLLYLKEQMEAEQDAERLLRRTEKRAFAAFKISFFPV
jgi:hypothetical protein